MISGNTMNLDHSTAYEHCLVPLLSALKWHGSMRTIKEAMPHYSKIVSTRGFCDVLKHLNYNYSTLPLDMENFDERLLPCLFVTEDNDVMVLLERKGGMFRVFDGLTNAETNIELSRVAAVSKKAKLYIFKPTESESKAYAHSNWIRDMYRQNKGLIYNALFLSLILNVLILSAPIFIMSVYDKVIGSSSYLMLGEFGGGIIIALIGIYLIYRLRAEHLSLLGARCDKMIGNRIVAQLLFLSPTYTETATAGAQVARIKDFDRVREAVAGPLLTVFFDLPFIFIALMIIAFLGGNLVLIPVIMLILYLVVGFILALKLKKRIKESSQSFADLQEFLLESIDNIRVIKYTASAKKWGERYRDKSAKTSLTSIRFSMYNAFNVAFSEVVMIGAGVLVLAFGAIKSMNGTLEIGAMLAIMILIWRVLTPIKTLFNTLPKALQLLSSIKQIGRLMALQPESELVARVKSGRINFKGDITFKTVSMRYIAAYTPSLLGVSINIKAGDFVAVAGRNGSGKSTLLKVLLGLYQPQAGGVLIDGHDVRQINPLDLRSSIGYLPQQPELFYGSVAANLRLGDPTASEEQIRVAAHHAGILEEIIAMPNGFDTRLTDQSTQVLAGSFRQSLCLARAYLRNASILLLDEPGNALDFEADTKLMKYIESIKGKVSVIMVTHRPSHLKKADHIVLLDQGQVALQGPPEEVLEKIPMEYL